MYWTILINQRQHNSMYLPTYYKVYTIVQTMQIKLIWDLLPIIDIL